MKNAEIQTVSSKPLSTLGCSVSSKVDDQCRLCFKTEQRTQIHCLLETNPCLFVFFCVFFNIFQESSFSIGCSFSELPPAVPFDPVY